jgi:hypothetical protein
LVKEYPTATDAQIEAAVAAAAKAHREWSRTSTVADRAALIRRVAELHVERKDELARIIQREMGKPLDQSVGEVEFSASIYEYYADNAEKFLADEPITLLDGDGSALIRRSSVGVLLGIMPWNYPYYQVARFAGPNLTLGNTIVLKHAPQCPESAAALQQIFTDAGYPEGAYVNIYATNEQIAGIIADPRIQGVSLTGSERAGAAVAEIAGRNLKKVVLELGGRRPLREHRPGLQRRQAHHRRRIGVRRLPRQVHREGAGEIRRAGPTFVGGRGRAAGGAGEPGRRCRRRADHQRQPQGSVLPTGCAHQRARRLPRGALRSGGVGVQGRRRGRGRRTGQ